MGETALHDIIPHLNMVLFRTKTFHYWLIYQIITLNDHFIMFIKFPTWIDLFLSKIHTGNFAVILNWGKPTLMTERINPFII